MEVIMERKIFAVTTIICLITFLGIIPSASAKTIDIAGPWLWMITPTPINEGGAMSINRDSLSDATDGRITEPMIVNQGANVGDFVGDYQWAPGDISVKQPGILTALFGDGNINDVLSEVGFVEGNVDHATSYAMINIVSTAYQEGLTMKVGSDDAIKVWLNGGEPVHTNAIDRSSRGYQDEFRVNLKAGDNLLVVKVSEKERQWRMFVGLDVPDTNTIGFKLPENVNIDTMLNIDPGSGTDVVSEPLKNSFEYHQWNLPTDLFSNVAVIDNATYFVWQPTTPEPKQGSSSIPYKSIFTLDLKGFGVKGVIHDFETARGLYDIGALPSEYPYFMVPLPSETPQQDATKADQVFTWWGVITSFFRNIQEAILGSILDEASDTIIGELDQVYPALRLNLIISSAQVIYATTQEALEKYREEQNAFNLITISLQNPSVTAETFSQFMAERNLVDINTKARYLVMIPTDKAMDELTMRMETYYYRKSNVVGEGVIRLILREDNSLLAFSIGDMHLFWEGENKRDGKIFLNVPNKDMSLWYIVKHWNEVTLVELFEFWAEGHGQTSSHNDFWDKWPGQWKDNKDEDGMITGELKAYITREFLGSLKIFRNLSVGNIKLNIIFDEATSPLEDPVRKFFGWYFSAPTIYMYLPIYEEVPEYPIVTHHEFTFNSGDSISLPALPAPAARPTSLAEYPPFQELTPQVQALLMRYAENVKRSKSAKSKRSLIPEQTSLLSNYPNPFNPETWVPYQLSEPSEVSIAIYAIDGTLVRTLTLGQQPAGIYAGKSRAAYWDGKNALGEAVASGVYFYTLKAGDFTATRKMLIRK